MPQLSELEQTVEDFRAALLSRERRAATELVRRYGQAWVKIKQAADKLLADIETQRKRGDAVGRAQLVRQERFKQLLQLVGREMAAFAEAAAETIQREQGKAVDLALRHSEELTILSMGKPPTPEAAQAQTWTRLPVEETRRLIGALQDGSPLGSLLAELGPVAVKGIGEALVGGVVMGQNPRVIARSVRAASGMELTRALRISRTEVLRAYRSAAIASYRRNGDVVNKWVWHARLGDKRTCPVCIAMHGTEHDLTEPFGAHPNCRCAPIPKTKTWAELGVSGIPETRPTIEVGSDWFARQDAEFQKAVLGNGKYQAYREGKIALTDLVHETTDRQWGVQRSEYSLEAALKRGRHT